jgi:hypothetical protein
MRTKGTTLIIAIAASLAIASPALAAPGSTNHDATSATLRDGADDVLLSDGTPLYAGREVASRIVDFADEITSDRFHFQPGHKRSVSIQHDSIDGSTAVPCEFTFIFFSTTQEVNTDWYNDIGIGESTTSDVRFVCHADSVGSAQRRFTVDYPDGADECADISRLDLSTWIFEVPGDCPATITTSIKEKGKTTTSSESVASAPMQITAVVP